MVMKFLEVGNSITVTIPKDIASKFCLYNGREADISVNDNAIVIKPITNKVTLKSLFANYNGNDKPSEIDWGEKKGNEYW